MAEDYKTITRQLEYRGPIAWLEQTLAASRIPIQGALNLPNGASIKSGIIVWQPDVVTEAQVNGDEDTNKGVAPVVKTVPFKRPGE